MGVGFRLSLLLIFLPYWGLSAPVLPPFPWLSAVEGDTSAQLFWQIDCAERELKPHAAQILRRLFVENCDRQAAVSEGMAFLCAVARREADERSFVRQLPLVRWLSPSPPLPWILLESLPFAERTAWQARGFLSEPLRTDKTQGRGFVALESLTRLFPAAPEPAWWKYLAAVSQRYPQRVASAERALVAQGIKVSDATGDAQAVRDGVSFGVAPQFGYRSYFGLFGGLRFWDERVQDLPRGISGGLVAFSNLTANAAVNFWDRHWLAPVLFEAGVSVGWDRHRYFSATPANAAYFRQGQGSGRVAVGYELLPATTLRVGYQANLRGQEYSDGGAGLTPIPSLTLHGPEASLTFDRRDSAVVPRDGQLGQIGVHRWLSQTETAQTEVWARVENYLSLSRRLSWNITAAGTAVTGNLARYRLPLWGAGGLALPGVAQERYRAQAGVGASTELQNEFAEGVRGLVFLTAVGLGDPIVRNESRLLGGGIGGEVAFTRKTRPTIRFELGWLSQEWNFRTDWRVAL